MASNGSFRSGSCAGKGIRQVHTSFTSQLHQNPKNHIASPFPNHSWRVMAGDITSPLGSQSLRWLGASRALLDTFISPTGP